VTRRPARAAGATLGAAIALTAVLIAGTRVPLLWEPSWLLLMGGAVCACALGGWALELCIGAWGDLAADVAGRCRPVTREKIR
jgi:hypothetical protein